MNTGAARYLKKIQRQNCTNNGQYCQTKYIDEVYLTMLDHTKNDSHYHQQLAYSVELLTCFNSGIYDITDP